MQAGRSRINGKRRDHRFRGEDGIIRNHGAVLQYAATTLIRKKVVNQERKSGMATLFFVSYNNAILPDVSVRPNDGSIDDGTLSDVRVVANVQGKKGDPV